MEHQYNQMKLELLTVIVLLAIILIVILSSIFTVTQQSSALIERFGKFVRICAPGLHMKIPFVEKIAGLISLRLMQLDVEIETKTLDDVFVKILTCVQYRVLPGKIYEAFYTLENPDAQIQAFVFDVVRARVPKTKLDDVFSRKDEIADSVKEELKEIMNEFGYDIIKTLVTDISPDARVKTAMNEINEAQRLRVAAMERGEAEKILKVKQAEAEAESKILQGKGMAGQRKEIMDGLKHSLSDFHNEIHDASTRDVMSLIMMTQYFDTLKEISTHSKMNTILIPHSPSSLHELYSEMRNTIIEGNQVGQMLKNED